MKLIDGANAQIEWNDDVLSRISELVVFDRKAVSPDFMEKSERKYASSHGACVGDWMKGERAKSTPEGQFLGMLLDGFANDDALLLALDQFGQIREAGWARTMAEALREELRARCGDDLESAEAIVSTVYE